MEKLQAIQAISPLDGRYADKVSELNQYCSEYGLIKYRIQVEIEWLIALSARGEIDCLPEFSAEEIRSLRTIYQDFGPEDALEVKEIESVTNHDVKAVEYFIGRHLKKSGLDHAIEMVHFACTSEDINNLAYGLMLKYMLDEAIFPICDLMLSEIASKAESYRDTPMMARTHGQPATPTTMGKEMHNVAERIRRQIKQLKEREILGKINGAVGNFNAHLVTYPEMDWRSFGKRFVESLGLVWNSATTQIEPHDYIAEICHSMIRLNTIVLDFDRDIWAYISNEAFTQIPVENQVGSSTMPHKINPIDFENSEGNIGIANAIFDHLAIKLPVSRWQRDLTDSTVLRNLGVGFAYSVIAYKATLKGLSKLDINRANLGTELKDAWLLLGEALQTVMRRYQIPEPYEKLKALTRGKTVDQAVLAEFIDTLDLPAAVKDDLKKLRPDTYLGYAKDF